MGIKDKLKIIARQALMVTTVAVVLGGSFALAYTALALSEKGEKNNPVELSLDPTKLPENKNNEGTASQPTDASPTPAPTTIDGTPLERKTIPEGIIPVEEAIAIARKGYLDYFGVDALDCVVIDTFSNTLATVYGSGELYEPLLRQKAFAGKKLLLVLLHTSASDYGEPAEARTTPPFWSFELLPDGADDGNILAGFSINAQTGAVIAGGLVRDVPEGETYSAETLQQMADAARQYIEKKEILGQAVIAQVDNIEGGSDISVTLSDGRVIVVTMTGDMEVVRFYVKGVWDDTIC